MKCATRWFNGRAQSARQSSRARASTAAHLQALGRDPGSSHFPAFGLCLLKGFHCSSWVYECNGSALPSQPQQAALACGSSGAPEPLTPVPAKSSFSICSSTAEPKAAGCDLCREWARRSQMFWALSICTRVSSAWF